MAQPDSKNVVQDADKEKKEQITEKTAVGDKSIAEWSWTDIAIKLDTESNNADMLYYFLISIIEDKKICKDQKCPIFVSHKRLNSKRLGLEFRTKEKAKENIKDQTDLANFNLRFDDYIFDAHDLFQDILSNATTRETKSYDEETYHQRNMDMLNVIANGKNPITTEVGKDIGGIMKHNSRMGEQSEELREYNEELERKHKEKENKEKAESKK